MRTEKRGADSRVDLAVHVCPCVRVCVVRRDSSSDWIVVPRASLRVPVWNAFYSPPNTSSLTQRVAVYTMVNQHRPLNRLPTLANENYPDYRRALHVVSAGDDVTTSLQPAPLLMPRHFVASDRQLQAGVFIGQYSGELISNAEAETRIRAASAAGIQLPFLLQITNSTDGQLVSVDATDHRYYTLIHSVTSLTQELAHGRGGKRNHSRINCAFTIYTDGSIWLVSTRTIKANEPLVFLPDRTELEQPDNVRATSEVTCASMALPTTPSASSFSTVTAFSATLLPSSAGTAAAAAAVESPVIFPTLPPSVAPVVASDVYNEPALAATSQSIMVDLPDPSQHLSAITTAAELRKELYQQRRQRSDDIKAAAALEAPPDEHDVTIDSSIDDEVVLGFDEPVRLYPLSAPPMDMHFQMLPTMEEEEEVVVVVDENGTSEDQVSMEID